MVSKNITALLFYVRDCASPSCSSHSAFLNSYAQDMQRDTSNTNYERSRGSLCLAAIFYFCRVNPFWWRNLQMADRLSSSRVLQQFPFEAL